MIGARGHSVSLHPGLFPFEKTQSVSRYQESEDLLKNSVVLAQRTCDELIAAAHQQADAIKREAEAEGKDIGRKQKGDGSGYLDIGKKLCLRKG